MFGRTYEPHTNFGASIHAEEKYFIITISNSNKRLAVADIVAQYCTSSTVKRWDHRTKLLAIPVRTVGPTAVRHLNPVNEQYCLGVIDETLLYM